MSPRTRPRVLVLGGGYLGLYTALGLQKKLGSTPMEITLVERNAYMTYWPLLPEVAGGHVQPRDVTVALRRVLKRTRIIRGTLSSLDVETKIATVEAIDGSELALGYDHVAIALGAVTRVFPTPGLEENAVGFKTLEEAVFTRNHVLDNLAVASATTDPAKRRKALTFVFIGGGYTGVEALSELSDLSKLAIRSYPNLDRSELRWILIEALDRVAPEVGPQLSKWTLAELRARRIDVRLETTVTSCIDGNVELSTGETIPANTIVWTAGVQPNPILDATNLPRGPKGHVVANTRLQVVRDDGSAVDGAWAAGDNAQVPDLTAPKQPAFYPPNAQNALRQAFVLSRNILATLNGGPLDEYRHKSLGTIASYGVGHGAALIMGVRLKNLPAWLAHRLYHGLVVPTVNLKVRVFAGWAVEAVTRPDISSLTVVERPKRVFAESFKKTEPFEKKGRHMTDGLSERESLAKDTGNSPESERETAAKQNDPVEASETVQDDGVDDSQVQVLPGTGGPDDVGDIEVDPAELNLSGESIPGHPKPSTGHS